MEILIDPKDLAQQMQFALTGYFVSVFIVSPVLTLALLRLSKGRRGVFIMVVLGLFLVFTLAFYGMGFLLRHVWVMTDTLGDNVIHGICLALGLLLILVLAIPLRIALNESPSPMQIEYDNLAEEQMTPMDIRRKEHLAKYNKLKR